MKKILAFILSLVLLLSLAACGQGNTKTDAPSVSAPAVTQPAAIEASVPDPQASGTVETSTEAAEGTASAGKALVVYFSYGENAQLSDGVDVSSSASIQKWGGDITGNTGVVAHMIQEATGADIFSIQTAEKYPSTYDATIDQGQAERNANARPALATQIENLSDYDVIFLGFPNWWYDMPMAIYSFLDEYDLSGKTIVPFVTSGGSGFSGAISTIESMEPGAAVLEGLSIGSSSATGAQEQVNAWLAELGFGLG